MSDVLRAWADYDRASTGIMAEASGWGAKVDPENDAAVLAWARQYLPRIMAHAQTTPHLTPTDHPERAREEVTG